MEKDSLPPAAPRANSQSLWPRVILIGCLSVLGLAILLPRAVSPRGALPVPAAQTTVEQPESTAQPSNPGFHAPGAGVGGAPAPETAEQIVARKASQFACSQREVLLAMARRRGLKISANVEAFFAAAQAGDWERLQTLFHALKAEREAQPHPSELAQIWGPILATFNALEQVHLWPAQEYLDYGNAILNSLRPGMVYVGGTDPGRGIPELLNATSEGEQHVVITQNGLADGTYLDYLRELYGQQLVLPSHEDAQRFFQQYVADAQQRYEHDQQFPNEPPQLKPGEDMAISDGRVTVRGQVAVMAINELILQDILQKNPTLAFGLEESFPLKSTYGDAAPLGPIMELRAPDGQNALSADTANQSLAYWQDTAQQVLADPAAADSPDWLKAYSKMVDAQANLYAAHGLNDQAEQAYQLSLQFWPGLTDSVLGYVNLLTSEDRRSEALAVAQSAAQADPKNPTFQNLVATLQQPTAQPSGRPDTPHP